MNHVKTYLLNLENFNEYADEILLNTSSQRPSFRTLTLGIVLSQVQCHYVIGDVQLQMSPTNIKMSWILKLTELNQKKIIQYLNWFTSKDKESLKEEYMKLISIGELEKGLLDILDFFRRAVHVKGEIQINWKSDLVEMQLEYPLAT